MLDEMYGMMPSANRVALDRPATDKEIEQTQQTVVLPGEIIRQRLNIDAGRSDMCAGHDRSRGHRNVNVILAHSSGVR